jgi:hypothetical protein
MVVFGRDAAVAAGVRAWLDGEELEIPIEVQVSYEPSSLISRYSECLTRAVELAAGGHVGRLEMQLSWESSVPMQ